MRELRQKTALVTGVSMGSVSVQVRKWVGRVGGDIGINTSH